MALAALFVIAGLWIIFWGLRRRTKNTRRNYGLGHHRLY